jgi:hypothetical protein
MVCSTLLQVTGADQLTLVCGNLLVGLARLSFAMRNRVYLLKLSLKVLQGKNTINLLSFHAIKRSSCKCLTSH